MIKFKKTTDTAILPKRATDGAAGFDLHYDGDPVELFPDQRMILSTGISTEFAPNLVGEIWPRSGWAVKYGLDTMAGVIDSDYRGVIKVVLINHGDRSVHIRPCDRIAQMVFKTVVTESVESKEISETARNAGGFGSTGVN